MRLREITSATTLRQAINKEFCLVYCNTSWSVPCRNQYSILVEMAEHYIGGDTIVQVDIEKYQDIAAVLAIQSIPTIVIFCSGTEKRRLVGLQSLEALQQASDNFLPA